VKKGSATNLNVGVQIICKQSEQNFFVPSTFCSVEFRGRPVWPLYICPWEVPRRVL